MPYGLRMKQGNYVGTEIGDSWWKRYRGSGFLARGNGEFWFDEDGIHFLRKLTKTPLVIKWDETREASLGTWHAGRWIRGRPIMKVRFARDGLDLTAGFYLGQDWPPMEQLADGINTRIGKT